ncbi:MAG: tRNA dihydrouridine synthase DusB [Clostridiales bacterium]|nr:tRNA dihydrouridine synthase DusB [Clostridiales bacterium]
MKIKIGNLEIKNQVVLAPMAGISNSSYRKIIKSMKAGLLFAEMVSDKAIVYESKKTYELLKMDDSERPIAQQIFGSDVDTYVEAAKKVEEYMHPDIIDLNMGCPVPKVAVKNQAGSALLKNPDKIYDIVSSVVKAVKVPVTVKIRSGWDDNSINAVLVAKMIEKAGGSAITVHPRTRKQGYSGLSDWNIIKEVKENVNIPVIGNGDVTSCYLAKKMLDETGCDAVMIGRACLGNPWLIKECVEYLEKGTIPKEVTTKEKINMIKKHYNLLVQDKGEKIALLEIRGHALWYLKGIKGSSKIKNEISTVKSSKHLFDILDKIEKN